MTNQPTQAELLETIKQLQAENAQLKASGQTFYSRMPFLDDDVTWMNGVVGKYHRSLKMYKQEMDYYSYKAAYSKTREGTKRRTGYVHEMYGLWDKCLEKVAVAMDEAITDMEGKIVAIRDHDWEAYGTEEAIEEQEIMFMVHRQHPESVYGEPYQCEKCLKTFKLVKDLRVHACSGKPILDENDEHYQCRFKTYIWQGNGYVADKVQLNLDKDYYIEAAKEIVGAKRTWGSYLNQAGKNSATEGELNKEIAEDALELLDSDIRLVMSEASCNRSEAIQAILENKGDIVNSIMALTM